MNGILSYTFMQNALAAGLLVSLACGVIGTLVVLKRMVFISGGVAHTAYGGIGMAFYFGVNPILSALTFSLGASLLMGYIQRKTRQRPDTLIGVMWAIGMAIGIIFTDLTPGYKSDLMSYLFGSILAVTQADLWMMLVVDVIVIGVAILFFKEFQATAFDESFARTRNIPVDLLYVILVTMIGLAVVMLMRVVGLIMIIALLTVPAAIGSLFLKNMGQDHVAGHRVEPGVHDGRSAPVLCLQPDLRRNHHSGRRRGLPDRPAGAAALQTLPGRLGLPRKIHNLSNPFSTIIKALTILDFFYRPSHWRLIMKKSLLLGVLLLTLLVISIAACSGGETPVDTSVPAAGDSSTNTDDDQVKALIEERCSSCHNTNIIYNANFDESGWSDVIDQMIQKGAVLSDSEKTMLIDWLIAQP